MTRFLGVPQDNHHARDGRHLDGQAEPAEQPVEEGYPGEDQPQVGLRQRGARRDRADIRVRPDTAGANMANGRWVRVAVRDQDTFGGSCLTVCRWTCISTYAVSLLLYLSISTLRRYFASELHWIDYM